MKTRIATVLSVIGVLGAGSAAALVNTQILDSGPSEPVAQALEPQPIELSIPEGSGTVPSTTVATDFSQIASDGLSGSTSGAYLTTYTIGAAGSVTVDVVDGRLLLVTSTPAAGWTVVDTSEDPDRNRIEVEFASGTTRVEFEASFIAGEIVPEVSSRSTTAGSAPSTTIDDDSDDLDDADSDFDDDLDDADSDDLDDDLDDGLDDD